MAGDPNWDVCGRLNHAHTVLARARRTLANVYPLPGSPLNLVEHDLCVVETQINTALEILEFEIERVETQEQPK